MIHTIEGHPPTGSPKASVLIIIIRIATKDIKQNNNPIIAAIHNGVVEKAIIPSKA